MKRIIALLLVICCVCLFSACAYPVDSNWESFIYEESDFEVEMNWISACSFSLLRKNDGSVAFLRGQLEIEK